MSELVAELLLCLSTIILLPLAFVHIFTAFKLLMIGNRGYKEMQKTGNIDRILE